MKIIYTVAFYLGLILSANTSYAGDYLLAVQPILKTDKLEQSYAPLAEYLSKQTGHSIKIQSFSGFKSYWYNMKRLKGFDMVIDAAHFVDYRVKNHNYHVIAKLPDTVSFSIVTREDLFLFDVAELADYRVATMVAPGIGGLRLMELFEDSDKSPTTVASYNAEDCIENIRKGVADAAVIPTSLVGNYDGLNVLTTTNPIPHNAFSISPKVPDDVARSIKSALLKADSTNDGRKALLSANLPLFIEADAKIYDGNAEILDVMARRKRVISSN